MYNYMAFFFLKKKKEKARQKCFPPDNKPTREFKAGWKC